jgi:hypothetical protein
MRGWSRPRTATPAIINRMPGITGTTSPASPMTISSRPPTGRRYATIALRCATLGLRKVRTDAIEIGPRATGMPT